MNIIIFILILIELLFLILSSLYLVNKTNICYVSKYIMLFMYIVILILLNIIIINMYSYNCSRKRYSIESLNNEITYLNDSIKNNKGELERLNNKLNSDEYVEIQNNIEKLKEEEKSYKEEIEKNKEILEELKSKYNSLKSDYEKLYEESKFIISPFPTYNQFPNYPNGCESVALYLLLKYNGVDVSVENIVEKLKKANGPFRKKGKLYGGDPEVEFVGDPRSKNGYGVYEKPIIEVAEYFKSGIKNITGSNLSDVLKVVSSGKPVQVWVSINLRDTYVCSTWIATSTGRIVSWLCGLHSLVVIGYTYDDIVTSDPYTGEIEYYDRKQFEKIYNTYGKRAFYYE